MMKIETIRSRLRFATQPEQLRFLASAVNALTIYGRFYYDQSEGFARLREINEANHRLSGHLRDIAESKEVLTESRLDGVIAEISMLPAAEVLRISKQLSDPDVMTGKEALDFAENNLRRVKVDASGWETELENPQSGERWIMDYPNSELHGGGSPRLRRMLR